MGSLVHPFGTPFALQAGQMLEVAVLVPVDPVQLAALAHRAGGVACGQGGGGGAAIVQSIAMPVLLKGGDVLEVGFDRAVAPFSIVELTGRPETGAVTSLGTASIAGVTGALAGVR